MPHPTDSLLTPIHIKMRPDEPWPDDPYFYYVTADGLFLCRNNRFFKSSVPAERGPGELAAHRQFLRVQYPRVPRVMFERIIGFFDRVGQEHNAEAAVLLAWDDAKQQMRAIVPDQVSTVSIGYWGNVWPLDVHYDVPPELVSRFTLIGDIHSHVDGAAYASYTDKRDETHRPGLHVVVGRINQDPPDLHIEVTVDGTRFKADPELALEGYSRRRSDFPEWWMDKITIEESSWYQSSSTSSTSSKKQSTQSSVKATTPSQSPCGNAYGPSNTNTHQDSGSRGRPAPTVHAPKDPKTHGAGRSTAPDTKETPHEG